MTKKELLELPAFKNSKVYRWQNARIAAKILNKMELGVSFYANLFPYLRKRGRLEGYCELGHHGKTPVWLYDTDGIADLVMNGNLDYKPR